jgi:hypothetical protein
MLSRLRQLRDHARQKLQLVDPLDVITSILLTATLLGMAATCPGEHFALLAVPASMEGQVSTAGRGSNSAPN